MNNDIFTDENVSVRKRDGSVEPFVVGKVRNCIRNGLLACGEPIRCDGATSAELADAVSQYLRQSEPTSPVPTSHIAELVDLVLSQTGHDAAGMAIKQFYELRDIQRRWVKIASPRRRDGQYVQRRWQKSRLVEHLMQRHTLEAPVARMMASRVEHLVLNCGLRVITAGLIEEMTKSELLAWGLLPAVFTVVKKGSARDSKSDVTNKNADTGTV